MTFRGIFEHRLTSFATLVLTLVVVGGSVVAAGFARMAGVSLTSAAVLAVLGLVVLATEVGESTRTRQSDIALARLRGVAGLRLVLFANVELWFVVVVGGLLGMLVGRITVGVLIGSWLPGHPSYSLGADEWLFGAGICLVAMFTGFCSTMACARRPLVAEIAPVRRPRKASGVTLFLQLLVIIAAVVVGYESRTPTGSSHDWLPLFTPVLVGLAAGQIVIWLLGMVMSQAVGRTNAARTGWFLTVRRMARRVAATSLLRSVVAAGVLAALSVAAIGAASTWRHETAKLVAGGPVRYPVHAGPLRAYAASVQADPNGDWLMPVAAYAAGQQSTERRVFVGASRWNAVVGDFFHGTGAAAVDHQIGQFPSVPAPVILVGDEFTASVPTSQLTRLETVDVVIQYVDDDGNISLASLRLTATGGSPTASGQTTFQTAIHNCAHACAATAIQFTGRTTSSIDITSLAFGSTPLLDPRLDGRIAEGIGIFEGEGYTATRLPNDGLRLDIEFNPSFGDATVVRYRNTAAEPLIATPKHHFDLNITQPVVQGIDGADRPVHTVGTVDALPFVGDSGSLLDLKAWLQGAGGVIPATHTYIVARANTPAAVLQKLRATGAVGTPTTFTGLLRAENQSPTALGDRLYVLVAVLAALVALLNLLVALAAQLGERRSEAASLRVVGISPGAVSSAYRREALLLAVVTLVGTFAAGWLSCFLLLDRLPLVSGWSAAPKLDTSPNLLDLALVSAVLAVLVGVFCWLAFARVSRAARPQRLREGTT